VSSVVVDASVAIKWFVPEVHSVAAVRWLEHGYDLLAPELVYSEVGNIVWKKIVRREISDEEGRQILQGFEAIPFQAHPTRGLLRLAFEIAFGLNRTIYDSTYLALAVAEGSVLVTADRKLYDVVAACAPLKCHIGWVEDQATTGS
jgi:predicted nucleic acid-binding protein